MRNQRILAGAWAVLLLAAPAGRAQEPGRLLVRLPADARLLIEGQPTRQTGEERRFHSPPLQPGRTYQYTLEATWTEDGKPVRRTRQADVRAGQETVVDFRREGGRAQAGTEDRGPSVDSTPPRRLPVDTSPEPPRDRPAQREKPPAVAGKPARTEEPPPVRRPPADKPPPDAGDDREPDVIFVPTPQEVVDAMLKLAEVKKDDVVYDLGCGDGRIVVTAAKKYGCHAHGFDIDPRRVEESLANVKKNDVGDLVTIQKKDIFTLDLSKANVVTLYLLPSLNVKLIPQLEKMKPGSRIVSHAFDMAGVKPKQVVSVKDREGHEHKVYLWEVPLQKE
jgi:uncharacterized protein (TIGR03000 family)